MTFNWPMCHLLLSLFVSFFFHSFIPFRNYWHVHAKWNGRNFNTSIKISNDWKLIIIQIICILLVLFFISFFFVRSSRLPVCMNRQKRNAIWLFDNLIFAFIHLHGSRTQHGRASVSVSKTENLAICMYRSEHVSLYNWP